jgi:hypothetical protein
MLPVGSNFSNVQIIAPLPANLKPGTYNLEVTANGAANSIGLVPSPNSCPRGTPEDVESAFGPRGSR